MTIKLEPMRVTFWAIPNWFNRNKPALATLLLLILLWEAIAATDGRAVTYFPGFIYSMIELYEHLDAIIPAIGNTLTEIISALLFSTVIAILVSFAISEVYTVRHMTLPYILFCYSIPFAVLAPVFLAVFGTGTFGVAIYAAWGGFFPIFINTVTGLTQIPSEYQQLADLTGATRWQRVRFIKFWAALPQIGSGIKISANVVITVSIVGELLSAGGGLGYLLVDARADAQMGLVFGTVVVIGVVGVIWFYTVSKIVEIVTPAT